MKVARRPVSPPLRKGRAAGGAAQQAAREAACPRRAMREAREQRSPWFRVAIGRPLNFAIVLEVFAGTGRFSAATSSHRPVLLWDILMGEAYNLADRANQNLVLGWLRAGLVCAVWMGTPCNSFSKARNRPGGPPALRTKEAVHGLDGLRKCDAMAFRLGNALALFSSKVLLVCGLLLIPGAIENPATSWLWQTAWMQRLAARRNVHFILTEFCQWQKAPFKNSTGFLHTCVDLSEIAAKRCLGARRGMCAATGKPHQPLCGLAPTAPGKAAQFWTKIAEPYPRKLCLSLSAAFDSGIAARRHRLVGPAILARLR